MTLEAATRLADWLSLLSGLGKHCHITLSPVGGPLQTLMRVEGQQGAEQGVTGMSTCSFIHSLTHSFIPWGLLNSEVPPLGTQRGQ